MTGIETRPGGRPPPETVLVVDDDVLVRIAIAAYLRDCGYRVIEAAGSAEAMQVLPKTEIAVDMVLSDVALTGDIDGFSLARWIRNNRTGLEVILVATPARAAEVAGDLCQEGPLMKKPYEPKLVVDRIRQLLGGRDRERPDGPSSRIGAG